MPTQQEQQQKGKQNKAQQDDGAQKQKGGAQPAEKLEGKQLASAVSYNKGQGYSKDKVRSLQKSLNVGVDGEIGNDTTQAVYAYQLSRPGLGNDGKLGPATLRSISKTGGAAATGSDLTPHQLASAMRFNRSRAFTRQVVRRIQNFIGVPDDAVFGPITIKEIARWQRGKGLLADGKVGTQTLGEMGITINNEPYTMPDPTPIETGPIPEGNVTSNFSWGEFATNDGTPVPSLYRDNVRKVAQQLEVLRSAVGGRSITINSAYRHPAYNQRVGGASNSQHLYAKAVDIRVAGMTPKRVHAKILELIKAGKINQGGVGKYNSFTHYDIRGSAARW